MIRNPLEKLGATLSCLKPGLVGIWFVLTPLMLAACVPNMGFTPKHKLPVPAATLAAMDAANMDRAAPILMRVFKADAKLEVWKKTRGGTFALLKSFDICRWSGDLGPKKVEGDRQAPEGFYTITADKLNPNSSYYLSFDTGFPNAYDRVHGYTGSNLMVHGDCSSRGCYAMTNEAVEEIYALGRDAFDGGQRAFQLQIFPFRMTAENMFRYRKNQHAAFWNMLKEGSDHFEVTGQEPNVAVCAGRYVFNQVPFDPNSVFEPASACPPAAIPSSIQNALANQQQQENAQTAQFMAAEEKERSSLFNRLLPGRNAAAPHELYTSADTVRSALPKASPEALSLLPGVEAGPTLELRRLAQLAPTRTAPAAGPLVANVEPYVSSVGLNTQKPRDAESREPETSPQSVVRKPAPREGSSLVGQLRGLQD